MIAQISLRNDTRANWTAANPILARGEIGFENDTIVNGAVNAKIGTGYSTWAELPYFTLGGNPGGGGGGTGSPGAPGTRGSLIYTGVGAPSVISGQLNNDLYIDTATGNVYQLVSGAWTLELNISGATGATSTIAGIIKLAGDLGGTYTAPVVESIQGIPVSVSDLAASGYGLYYNAEGIYLAKSAQLPFACGCASSANIALTGTPTVDGYATGANGHILLFGQTTASQNGPWIIVGAGEPFVRPPGWYTGDTLPANVYSVQVTNGTLYAGTEWHCNIPGACTVDTTSTTWTQFSAGGGSYTGTAPIVVTGTVISASAATSSTPGVVQPDNSTITVSSGVISAAVPYGNFIVEETPSGSVNGSNTTFTLANTPHSGSLMLFVNGVLQKPTSQYSLSSATITFVSAPKSGFWLTASYQK